MASTQNRFAYWNPFRSDLFTAYGNNKLEVCQIVKEGASQRIEEMAGIDCTLATCVEWSSGTPNTLAFGDSSGDVAVWNWEKSKKVFDSYLFCKFKLTLYLCRSQCVKLRISAKGFAMLYPGTK